MAYPCGSIRHVPSAAEDVHGAREQVVVYEARVHGERAHQQYYVAAAEECLEDLVADPLRL